MTNKRPKKWISPNFYRGFLIEPELTMLQLPELVSTVGVVLVPDLHPDPGVHVAVWDVEYEVVPLTAQVFPLQPPLLVNPTMMIPAQHSGSWLLTATL